MRVRLFTAAAAAAVLAATVPAHAATPTLDGKKVKTLTFTGTATPQTHDTDLAGDQAGANPAGGRPADYTHCPASRCFTWKFVYKPAKGVRPGPVSVKLSWTLPVEDFDLYVFDAKFGDVGHCGASAGTSETVTIDPATPGHTYLIVADEYRAGPDTVKATVNFPATAFTSQVPGGAPATVAIFPVGCGLNK
ncbi:MAG: hypothetical protein JO079_11915 [Frankiaceae bacterium]|nr:hypothetical protein [Frankiaceae bacterium]MBV9369662.1 hypothetical protein [Frankiales bacterium]